jgi:hypothetical protein
MEQIWTALESEDRTNGITVHSVSEFNVNEIRSRLQTLLSDRYRSLNCTTNHTPPGIVWESTMLSCMPMNTMLSQQTLVTQMDKLMMADLKKKLRHILRTECIWVSLDIVSENDEKVLYLVWGYKTNYLLWM